MIEISEHVKKHFYKTTFDTAAWNQFVDSCREQLVGVMMLDQFDAEENELLISLGASHTYFFMRNNPKRYQLLGRADINYLNLFRKPVAIIKCTPRDGMEGHFL